MNDQTTANLPAVLSPLPEACDVPAITANAEDEPARNRPEQPEKSLLRRPDSGEPEWHEVEHSQKALSTPQEEEEPDRDDPERFQNSFERELAVDETRWHELERFHVPHSEYLCERQQLAIRLLLIGEREGKVAQKVGIGRTTLWRWRKDIHFRAALAACRNLAYANAMERIDGLVSRAVDRIEEQVEQRDRLAPFRIIRLARADRPKTPDDPERA